MSKYNITTSDYFNILEIKTGIYAAIAKEKTGVYMNAGFFDLGNYLIIFDTSIHPEATRDILKAARQITNKEPTFLINSHFHFDHTMGNHVLPLHIPIISSPATLEQYNSFIPKRFKEFLDMAPTEKGKLLKKIEAEENKDKLFELNSDLKFWNEISDPKFKLRPPDTLVDNRIAIIGKDLTLELIHVGPAHSPGDLLAYFPDEKICFMADLIFEEPDPEWAKRVEGIPFAVDPNNHLKVLKEYKEKDIEVYFTSHGNLSSKDTLQVNMDYIKKYWIES